MGLEVEIEHEYKLTESELIEAAREHVRATEAHDKLVELFKDDRASWRSRIKEARQRRDDIGKKYMNGSEKRKTLAVEHPNLETKKFEYIHEGKVIKTRDMTPEDIALHGTQPMFDEPRQSEAQMEIGHVIAQETRKGSKADMVTKAN